MDKATINLIEKFIDDVFVIPDHIEIECSFMQEDTKRWIAKMEKRLQHILKTSFDGFMKGYFWKTNHMNHGLGWSAEFVIIDRNNWKSVFVVELHRPEIPFDSIVISAMRNHFEVLLKKATDSDKFKIKQ